MGEKEVGLDNAWKESSPDKQKQSIKLKGTQEKEIREYYQTLNGESDPCKR